MLDIFKVLPPKFFSKLNGKNKIIYADMLSFIYDHCRQSGLTYIRDEDEIYEVLSLHLSQNNAELSIFDEDSGTVIKQKDYDTLAKALIKEASKKEVGWFEIDHDYSESYIRGTVGFTYSGIRLAEFLNRFKNVEFDEFTGHLLNIWNNIQNQSAWKQAPYHYGLERIYKESQQLAQELRRMTADIKEFIQVILNDDNTCDAITNNIITFFQSKFLKSFNDYCEGQNMCIFKKDCIDFLKNLKVDQDAIDDIVIDYIDDDEERPEALENIYRMINIMIRFFESESPNLINSIKNKIIKYSRVLNLKLELKKNYNIEDIQKDTEELIKYIVRNYDVNKINNNVPVSEDISKIFNLHSFKYLSHESMYKTRQKPLKVKDPSIIKIDLPTKEELEAEKRQMNKAAQNPYSEDNCNKYVNEILKDKTEITVKEMNIKERSDVIMSVALTLYGETGNYKIVEQPGYIKKQSSTIKNYKIVRTEEEEDSDGT